MAIELPASPKVYTTKYTNFKGVDFTNDPTNVWYRRSPSGVNMLPDASGRPFKRHGWSILLSNNDLCDALSLFGYEEVTLTEDEFNADKTRYFVLVSTEYVRCTDASVYDDEETYYIRIYPQGGDDPLGEPPIITKCSYFELAGVDHIVIFTDKGVIFYNGEVTAVNTDYDCYTGYDRSFFFEGDGTSAFYIYGNFKVWRYESDFILHDASSQVTVPTVLIGAEANCVGTMHEGYNLLGTRASVEYCDKDLFAFWGTDKLSFEVDKTTFTTAHAKNYSMTYTYKTVGGTTTWYDTSNTAVTLSTHGITVYTAPKVGDQIFVVNAHGVLFPNNVSIAQYEEVSIFGTKTDKQFGYEMETINTGTPSVGQCLLHPDTITDNRERQQAWVEFSPSESFTSVDGEDYIKAIFPTVTVTITPYVNESYTSSASLVGA